MIFFPLYAFQPIGNIFIIVAIGPDGFKIKVDPLPKVYRLMVDGKGKRGFTSQTFIQKPDGVGREIRKSSENCHIIINTGIHMACNQGLDNHSATAFIGFDLGLGQILFGNGFASGTQKDPDSYFRFIHVFKGLIASVIAPRQARRILQGESPCREGISNDFL